LAINGIGARTRERLGMGDSTGHRCFKGISTGSLRQWLDQCDVIC
jgi:hypothetical protein